MDLAQLEKALRPYGCTLAEFEVIRGDRDQREAWDMFQTDYLTAGQVLDAFASESARGDNPEGAFSDFQKELSDLVLSAEE